MNQDLELPLFRAAPDDPNVEWLVTTLDQAQRWMLRSELVRMVDGRLGEREIRALASAAARPPEPRIIAGQLGYRSVKHATLDEIRHAAARLRSQASEMDSRGIALLNYVHRMVA